MASYLQLVGSGSRDSHVPAAAAIVFEQSRYLFGAGEGTQRMATEAHMKLAKMKQVFITRIQHEQVGGLTGQQKQSQHSRTPAGKHAHSFSSFLFFSSFVFLCFQTDVTCISTLV